MSSLFKHASSCCHDNTGHNVVLDEATERRAVLWPQVLVVGGHWRGRDKQGLIVNINRRAGVAQFVGRVHMAVNVGNDTALG